MSGNVILFPVIKRPEPYELHMALQRRKKRSEEPKALEQEMTDQSCTDTWRNEKFGNALVWVERALENPLGGREWVLEALDRLKQYVERK
jgi:hypothetical protein